ncbi:unnamed protein product [Rotaria sp. Silwood2]|nr:unnamed protein product [Rotaria sp. Silwood2]
MTASNESGICGFLWLTCSQLVSCGSFNHICYQPNHICVHHSRCFVHPVCYPLSMMDQAICPPKTSPSRPGDGICINATWTQNATTVAGGNGIGSSLSQLYDPFGFFVDENGSIYVVDTLNYRIVKWDRGVSSGQLVAGGNGLGDQNDQFNEASDIIVDKDGTMYISDYNNERIQRWVRGAQNGETILRNISAIGIAQDDQGSLYTSDWIKSEVRKWRVNETVGQLITSNLSSPRSLFVDRNRSVYVGDTGNNRVIKVDDKTAEVTIVAGGSFGDGAHQLNEPEGIFVDELGTIYVADTRNHRIMRWSRGATSGSVIAGGRGEGSQSDQLFFPTDLSFDLDRNLYVVDNANNRVQKFLIDKNLC